MTSLSIHDSPMLETGPDPQTIFETDWHIYRQLVDNNLFSHWEVSELLIADINPRFNSGFRFLDLACGDAEVMSRALRQTTATQYHGVDLSPQALALAQDNLAPMSAKVRLEQKDIQTALSENQQSYDVIWCGLCLHHFESLKAKTDVLSAVWKALRQGGVFYTFEPVLPAGLSRDTFNRKNRPNFQRDWSPPLSDAEFERMMTHIETCDFPETADNWIGAGLSAGFKSAEEVFAMPGSGYCRLFRFQM